VHEAELLDNNEIRAWFALLDPEVSYTVPLRVTRERTAGPGFSRDGFHMKEDYGSLETRVTRLETEYAWAEDPPSRIRRFVGNFRIRPGERENEISATTNVLIFRGRFDSTAYDLLSCERRDVLRYRDDQLKILERVVLLDHTTLATHNLAFFF
jgi:3-phenylpropionate/cinnamic acid dioxygenase small subunit